MRIALATLRFRSDPDEALRCVQSALEEAARRGAKLLCTPENYLPGLRGVGFDVAPPNSAFLARAERTIRATAAATGVGAIVGIERIAPAGLIASAMIVAQNGRLLGFQDKVQIDPSEEGTYTPGTGREIFEIDGLRFGVVICHEGWRYPETVRWAKGRSAVQGAAPLAPRMPQRDARGSTRHPPGGNAARRCYVWPFGRVLQKF